MFSVCEYNVEGAINSHKPPPPSYLSTRNFSQVFCLFRFGRELCGIPVLKTDGPAPTNRQPEFIYIQMVGYGRFDFADHHSFGY